MIQLSRAQLEQLIAQAKRDAPFETCGIIGGKDGRATKIYPLKNIDPEPVTRYQGDPQQQLDALREIDDNGWDLLSIYHSHPATQPYPSPTDVARAFYPDSVYLLISLMNPEQAKVRAYRIVDEKISEITLEVEDANESPAKNSRRRTRRTNRPRAHRAVAALSKRRPARRNVRGARRRVSKKV